MDRVVVKVVPTVVAEVGAKVVIKGRAKVRAKMSKVLGRVRAHRQWSHQGGGLSIPHGALAMLSPYPGDARHLAALGGNLR